MVIEQVKRDRCHYAHDGRKERRTHTGNQPVHTGQQRARIRSVEREAGQAHHKAHERAQNAQRGEHARGKLRKAGAAAGFDNRFLVDVLRHVAGAAVCVAHFGILQEVRPRALQLIAEEAQVVPGLLLLILAVFRDNYARRAAKARRHARKREDAPHQRRHKQQQHGQINQHIQRKYTPNQRQDFHLSIPPDMILKT